MANKHDKILGEFRENDFSLDVPDARYLKLDQTTPQTIISGTPIFNVGIKSNDAVVIKAEKLLILDGA